MERFLFCLGVYCSGDFFQEGVRKQISVSHFKDKMEVKNNEEENILVTASKSYKGLIFFFFNYTSLDSH